MKYLLIFWGVSTALFLSFRIFVMRPPAQFEPYRPWHPSRSKMVLFLGFVFAFLPGIALECLWELVTWNKRTKEHEEAKQEKLAEMRQTLGMD